MSMSEIERVEKISRLNQIADKVSEGAVLTTADRDEFEGIEIALRADNAEHEQWHGPRNPGDVSTLSRETQAKVNANRALIGTETHHLPEPGDGRPLEARHDLTAYLSQRKDFNPTGIDFGSFDRDAFWRQVITRQTEGREYRALAEGAQSATFTGAGVLVPIGFSADVLALLRANLVFTSPGTDGAINGPMVVPMERQIEYVPTWSTDPAGVTSYVGENPTLTPGTAALGSTKLTAYTMANVQIASRQLVE